MRFVDDDDVNVSDASGALSDRLDPGYGDLVQFLPVQSRRVDAERRFRPDREDFVRVLLKQFLHVTQNQNPRTRP